MKKILVLTAFALASLPNASESKVLPEQLSAAENYAKAQEYAAQADIVYPFSHYDRSLWKAAVGHARHATTQETSNRDYNAYLAQLYTKTKWWANAYRIWQGLGQLQEPEKPLASLCATKLAYLAFKRGDQTKASEYVEQGMKWASNSSLQEMKERLDNEKEG